MRPLVAARGWLAAASAAQITALAFGAATNVFYAYFLEPAQIGRLAILLALAGGILVVADSGLQSLLGREVAIGAVPCRVAATLLLVIVPSIVVALTALVYGLGLAGHTFLSTPALSLTSAALLLELAVTMQVFQGSLALFQGLGLYGRRSVAVAINGVATMCITAGALGAGGGLAAAIHATALAYACVAIVVVVPLLRANGLSRVRFTNWLQFARRGSSLYGNTLLGFMTTTADVLLAAAVLPIATVGYYQVIKKISLVALAPFAAILPLVYSHLARLGESAREPFYRKVQTAAAGLISAGLIVGAPFAHPILAFAFGSRYASHAAVLIALVGIGGLQFTHNLLGYVAASAGRFDRPLLINVSVASTGAILAVSLGRLGGLNGFVLGLAIANAFGVLVAVRLALEFVRGAVRVGPMSLVALMGATSAAMGVRDLPLSAGVSISATVLTFALACLLLPRFRPHLRRTRFVMRDS